jgi:asparagine synthase (glutamine-hydrolysing)
MCGIWGLIQLNRSPCEQSEKQGDYLDFMEILNNFNNIKHRGPDNSILQNYKNVWIGFHRLAIIDTSFVSNQPFILNKGEDTIVFVCNGEIYNYKELIEQYDLPKLNSDCMTIPQLYLKHDYHAFNTLFHDKEYGVKGEFAFLLFEFDKYKNIKHVVVGRDTIGIRPLYYHPPTNESKQLIFSSEIKGTNNFKDNIIEFPPGQIMKFSFDDFGKYKETISYKFNYYLNKRPSNMTTEKEHLSNIRSAVIASVRRRLESDQPLAFLLSGGVDSSLIACISAKLLGVPIRTFCCGMNEGTDLVFARKVAQHIGSNHTEVFFTPQEGLDAIRDVIHTVESWDTTTIRASVGQYLVCKYIGTKTDAKVVLVGEGPDEVCSSYLCNWYAPDGDALHNAAKQYVEEIHYFDSKRGDRCISRWGLEGRVPCLDPEFISAYWSVPSEMRMPKYKNMEKWWLRKAFDNTGIIPDEVLWRKKEAFSDGVSGKEKSWFQIIQEYIEPLVSDEEFAQSSTKYEYNTPKTKEAYYYRKVFCELFGENRQNVIPHYWQPKWSSDGKETTDYIDPSARVLKVYN